MLSGVGAAPSPSEGAAAESAALAGAAAESSEAVLAGAAADVSESEADYPENRMFGNLPLPAFGLYVRHADEVVLERVRFSLAPGSADARPPVAADDSTMFRPDSENEP